MVHNSFFLLQIRLKHRGQIQERSNVNNSFVQNPNFMFYCLIAMAKLRHKTMQKKDFFELSRPTIRHYTYRPFSLYALYTQLAFWHKKSEQKCICSLQNYIVGSVLASLR